MAQVIIPTEEQWAVLRDLGLTTSPRAVIVSPRMAYKLNLTNELAEAIAEDYDFGGDPDCWVEVVVSEDHYFIDHAKEKNLISGE